MDSIIATEENRNADEKPTKKECNSPAVIPVTTVIVFLGATIITALLVEVFVPSRNDIWSLRNSSALELLEYESPKYAIYGKSESEEHLIHVIAVLKRFGYQRTTVEDEWDLLWAHDYPFLEMSEKMKNLEPDQKVNHLPGCGFITNKVDLSTTPLPFLPKAFKLPIDKHAFLEYANDNPKTLFVEKHNDHRFIAIKNQSDINFETTDTFVQEFVQNPFLVDGYKFDIGVYVVITSVDPLRVYIYTGDVLFRYCSEKYYPFDAKNINKYVVGDDYLPTWELPTLAKFYKKYSSSMRDAFDAYVRDQSKDPSKIWLQVEDIIRQTILAKESHISRVLRLYKTRNFFELMRFDLIIDDELRVILMEANMSPNLSSAHFKENSLLYEQILYSVFNLVGVGSPVKRKSLKLESNEIEDMMSAEPNLVTNVNLCNDHDCDNFCNLQECQLCLPCLTESSYEILENAFREHLHKTNMKRLFPRPITLNPKHFDINREVQNLTLNNQWMSRWFYGKCLIDHTWCY